MYTKMKPDHINIYSQKHLNNIFRNITDQHAWFERIHRTSKRETMETSFEETPEKACTSLIKCKRMQEWYHRIMKN